MTITAKIFSPYYFLINFCQSHPVTIIYIEIQSRQIEFYSASVMINAHLSGLRYLMFHWPLLSSVVGICTNLFFIVLICVLSYLHFATEEEIVDDPFSYEKGSLNEDEKDAGFTGDCKNKFFEILCKYLLSQFFISRFRFFFS